MSKTNRNRSWHDGRRGEPSCLGDWKFRTRPNLAKRVLAKERGCRCEKCGQTGPRGTKPIRMNADDYRWLHLDHITPLVDLPLENRNKFDRGNLQMLCETCHGHKTAMEATARAARRRAARMAAQAALAVTAPSNTTLLPHSDETLVA